jgi:uncharacterized protein (TIGR02246 family)
VFVCAAILTVTTTTAVGAQASDARAAIEAATAKFSAAFKAGNAADMAAFYADDAVLLPPNSQVVRGRPAIQKLWQDFIDSGAKELALTTTDVEAAGMLASETGTARVKDAAGKILDEAKYVVVWKQVGGKWMIYRDIWNSNAPPVALGEKKQAP